MRVSSRPRLWGGNRANGSSTAMRVLVVGAGEVGFHLAQRLSEEHQDVVVIEADPERAQTADQKLDVQTIVGNGASISILEQAKVRDAQMLLAVTSADEVNLTACLVAKRMGVPYTVARISNPDYYEEGSVLSSDQVGIDLMVNPERECARVRLFCFFKTSHSRKLLNLQADGCSFRWLKVLDGAPVAGKSIGELRSQFLPPDTNAVTGKPIVRDGQTIIPRAETTIEAGIASLFVGSDQRDRSSSSICRI